MVPIYNGRHFLYRPLYPTSEVPPPAKNLNEAKQNLNEAIKKLNQG